MRPKCLSSRGCEYNDYKEYYDFISSINQINLILKSKRNNKKNLNTLIKDDSSVEIMEMNGEAISSGMGTCGLVGQIGVYTGWVNDVAAGTKAAITPMDWLGLVLISFVLPAVLTWGFGWICRKLGWIKEGDLKLN